MFSCCRIVGVLKSLVNTLYLAGITVPLLSNNSRYIFFFCNFKKVVNQVWNLNRCTLNNLIAWFKDANCMLVILCRFLSVTFSLKQRLIFDWILHRFMNLNSNLRTSVFAFEFVCNQQFCLFVSSHLWRNCSWS